MLMIRHQKSELPRNQHYESDHEGVFPILHYALRYLAITTIPDKTAILTDILSYIDIHYTDINYTWCCL